MTPASGFRGMMAPHGADPQIGLTVTGPALSRSGDGALLSAAWGPSAGSGSIAVANPAGLAFHGEIYNHLDLCRQLGLPADTPLHRVLAAGWQRWAAGLLSRLNGVYALALRDGDGIVLYRDASGLANLYAYTGCSEWIGFATDIDSLLGLPGTQRQVARRSLHEYLRFLDIAAPNTLFDDVISLEAGLALRWSVRATETLPAASLGAHGQAPASFSAAVNDLDAHLQRSVLARLASARRPAAFLSGGVDSALLCAMAARQRKDLTAVTVGFDGDAFDETPVAQRIAAHLGIKHEVLRFSRQDYLTAFERLAQEMAQPMADPATPATLLAFDHCRSRFDVVLDGTGADEAIGMMPPRHVRLAISLTSRLSNPVRNGLTRFLRTLPGVAGLAPIFDFEHPAETMIRWSGFKRPEIEALCGEPVSFVHTQFYRTFESHPRHAHFERYSALLRAMPCERLNQARLVSNLIVRYPFCDSEVDCFMRQLQTDYRHLPGQPKRILRALLATYLPSPMWDLPKHGFNFPLNDFLRADNFALVRHHLDVENWRSTSILSRDQVGQVARQFIEGDQYLTFRVWTLTVLSAWLDKHDMLG